MHNQHSTLDSLENGLKILSPENVLKRGYSITSSNGLLINKKSKLKKGETLLTETKDHIIHSTVTEQSSKS